MCNFILYSGRAQGSSGRAQDSKGRAQDSKGRAQRPQKYAWLEHWECVPLATQAVVAEGLEGVQ